MKVINNKNELRSIIAAHKHQKKTISLVPTMGFLHEGHTSLIKTARSNNDIVVVSIFVNPLQFGPKEDLAKYPRNLPADIAICEKYLVDILFIPEPAEMFSHNPELLTYVNVQKLDQNLCGAKRSGHFKGVCTIVSKLFNIVSPDRAYFGKKDIQQLRIIRQMVTELDFPVKIIGCETYRNPEGLALSSRNSYLTPDQQAYALIIPQTLQFIQQLVKSGITETDNLITLAQQSIEQKNIPQAKLDYIEIVDNRYLQKTDSITNPVIVAIALYIGTTRLIDNVIIDQAGNKMEGEE